MRSPTRSCSDAVFSPGATSSIPPRDTCKRQAATKQAHPQRCVDHRARADSKARSDTPSSLIAEARLPGAGVSDRFARRRQRFIAPSRPARWSRPTSWANLNAKQSAGTAHAGTPCRQALDARYMNPRHRRRSHSSGRGIQRRPNDKCRTIAAVRLLSGADLDDRHEQRTLPGNCPADTCRCMPGPAHCSAPPAPKPNRSQISLAVIARRNGPSGRCVSDGISRRGGGCCAAPFAACITQRSPPPDGRSRQLAQRRGRPSDRKMCSRVRTRKRMTQQ